MEVEAEAVVEEAVVEEGEEAGDAAEEGAAEVAKTIVGQEMLAELLIHRPYQLKISNCVISIGLIRAEG